MAASYNSVCNVQYEVQFISVLKSTLCLTGGRVFADGTDQIMVSFWQMCRVLQGNIQTLHGAENQNKIIVWNTYYNVLSKFNLSKYILLQCLMHRYISFFISVW